MKSNSKKISFLTYLSFSMLVIVLISILLLGLPAYLTISNIYNKEMINKLETIATSGALLIDGDRLAALDTGSEQDPYYKEIFAKLLKLKLKTKASYIYTMRLLDNDKPAFIVDADPENANPVNTVYPNLETEMRQAFNGKIGINTSPTYDPSEKNWSQSAYAPIRNSAGNIVAIIGVDLTANKIVQEKNLLLQEFFTIGLAGLIMVGLLCFIIARVLNNPLQILTRHLSELASAKGDLTKRITTQSFLKEISSLEQAINNVQENSCKTLLAISNTASLLNEIGTKLLDTSQTVSANTEEMSALTEEMYGGAETQAATTTNMTQIIKILNNNFLELTKATSEAEAVSVSSNLAAKEGQIAITDTLAILNDISSYGSKLNSLSLELENRSEQIRKILIILTDIAKQTKVLSLNADIEASKAGEAGRGFSVVAQQIRALAENAQSSVVKISGQIAEVENVLSATAKLAQNFYQLTETSTSKASLAGTRLFEIENKSNISLDFVKRSAALTESEMVQIEETTNKIQEISEISDKFTDSSRAIAVAAEEQARTIQDVLNAAQDIHTIVERLNGLIAECKLQ